MINAQTKIKQKGRKAAFLSAFTALKESWGLESASSEELETPQ